MIDFYTILSNSGLSKKSQSSPFTLVLKKLEDDWFYLTVKLEKNTTNNAFRIDLEEDYSDVIEDEDDGNWNE